MPACNETSPASDNVPQVVRLLGMLDDDIGAEPRHAGTDGAEAGGDLIHGHTHNSFDYSVKGTRVVCNPRGYVGYQLVDGFDSARTVTLA